MATMLPTAGTKRARTDDAPITNGGAVASTHVGAARSAPIASAVTRGAFLLSPPAASATASSSITSGVRSIVFDCIFGREGVDRARYTGARPELPGPLAQTLTRATLAVVLRSDYWVCEKSDGERFMLLGVGAATGGVPPGAYMIDRTFSVYCIPDGAEYASILTTGGITLLDGELIRRADDAGSGTGAHSVYMMFDAVYLNGRDVGRSPFADRMAALLTVRTAFVKADAVRPAGSKLPLLLLGKHFARAADVATIFACIHEEGHANGDAAVPLTAPLESAADATGAGHAVRMYRNDKRVNGTDGVVLTPGVTSYRDLIDPRAPAPLLKWKFADENTVDFKLRRHDLDAYGNAAGEDVGRGGGVQLYLGATGVDAVGVTRLPLTLPAAEAYLALMSTLRVSELIVECAYDASATRWVVKRVRDRKTRPNHVTTGWQTMEVMAENITQEELCRALGSGGRAGVAR